MAETPRVHRLANSLAGFALEEAEQKRIAQVAIENGLPAHIIRTYGPKTKPYLEVFQKKEKISGGFRPGTLAFDKQATARLIQYLGQPKQLNFEFFWKIYKEAFSAFLRIDLKRLHALLESVETPARIQSSAELVKAICVHASEYDVLEADVRQFYEACWIPRAPEFEELLPLCNVKDEAKEQRKRISKLETNLEGLRETSAQALGRLDDVSGAIARLIENAGAAEEMLEAQSETLGASVIKLQELAKAEEQREKWLKHEIVTPLVAVAAKVRGIEQSVAKVPALADLKSEVKRAIDEMKSGEAKARKDSLTEVLARVESRIQELVEGLESKLETLIKDAQANRASRGAPQLPEATGYRSPLVSLPAPERGSWKIGDELGFANAMMACLSAKHGIIASFEEVLAHHTLLTSAPIAIMADKGLCQAWIDCLGWSPFTLHLAASPMWASEADWKDGLEYLFRESGAQPRVVVIHNYDVAMVECYLAPTLHLWAMKCGSSPLSRLILIPSGAGRPPRQEIIEHAPILSVADYGSSGRLEVEGIRVPPPIKADPPAGVDPRSFKAWTEAASPLQYDFKTIKNSIGIEISEAVLNTFSKVTQKARAYFSEPSAVGLGMRAVVLPWVKARYGESAYSGLGELLKQLPDVRC